MTNKIKMEWSCIIGLWRRDYPDIRLKRDGEFTDDHVRSFLNWANGEAQGQIFKEKISFEQARAILDNPRTLIGEVV